MIKKLIFIMIYMVIFTYTAKSQGNNISSVTLSDDGYLLAIARNNGDIQIFQLETSETITTISHNYGFAYKIEWESNNQRIATTHPDGITRIWSVNEGNLIQEITMSSDLLDLEWSQNGKLYISSLEGGTYIWDMTTYELIEILSYAGYDLNFSPNEEYLAVGGLRSFSIYNMESDIVVNVPSNDTVIYTVWSPDGTKLATINLADEFTVWNVMTNQIEITFQMQSGSLMKWQGDYLYVYNEKTINIWDTTTWQIMSSIHLEEGSFVSRNSLGLFYAEYNLSEIVEIATYCEIIPSGHTLALSNAISDENSTQFRKQICLAENATYTLSSTLPSITSDITIIGNGTEIIMTGEGQIFDVAESGMLHLKNLTLVSNNAEQGGAIDNAGELNLESVRLENGE